MNSADRPPERVDTAANEPDIAKVIPFPRGGREGRNRSEVDWTFNTEVRGVHGAECEWLRNELAGVVRDLLVWASDDMSGGDDRMHGQERRAA